MNIRKTGLLAHLALMGLLIASGVTGCRTQNLKSPEQVAAQHDEEKKASYMFVDLPEDTRKQSYIHKSSSWETPDGFADECKFERSLRGTSDADLKCLIEGEELDLYDSGVTFRYNVPKDMCNYVIFSSYWYWDWQPGTASGTICVDANGNMQDSINANPAPCVTSVGAKATTNYAAGDPFSLLQCRYDYSDRKGPNCCEGEVKVGTAQDDGAGNTILTYSKTPFGGNHASCAAGPAVDTMPLDKNGFPMDVDYYTQSEGVTNTYQVQSPRSKELQYNLYVANYFKFGSETRHAIVNPFYEIGCYDAAWELLGRIRVMVRDWNTESQFLVHGDPDVLGNDEGGLPDSYCNNDRLDWGSSAAAPAGTACAYKATDSDGIGDTYPEEMTH